MSRPGVAVILSAGGLRGVAHLGVLRQLQRHDVPIDAMIGVSAGAIIAGYFAGVGLTAEEMIAEAPCFKGRHLAMHGITLHAPQALRPMLRRFCGIIPHRLSQLDAGRFDRLYNGVNTLGIVCHDLLEDRPIYFSSLMTRGASLAQVVRASASVPGLIPSRTISCDGRQMRLVDGGISDSLPIAFARADDFRATRFIVSDCRRYALDPPSGDDVVYIRPTLNTTRTFKAPAATLMETVEQGEAAVTADVVRRIHGWLAAPARTPVRAVADIAQAV